MSIRPNDGKSYKLAELIDYYEICNRAEGKSPKTLSWYSANLGSFDLYLRSRHIPDQTDNIDIQLLREYVLYLFKRNCYQDHPYTPTKDTPLSTATIHGHVRTLRAFFSWLTREEFIQQNPCSNCMLICWPEMKDRQENYRLLRTSGKVTKNDTYMRVSTL